MKGSSGVTDGPRRSSAPSPRGRGCKARLQHPCTTEPGLWRYQIANGQGDPGLAEAGTLAVAPARPGRDGFLRADRTYPQSVVFDSGRRPLLLGTTAYALARTELGGGGWRAFVDGSAAHGLTKVRTLVHPWNVASRFPYRAPFVANDHDRLDLAYWQALDRVVAYTTGRGLLVDLILFTDEPRAFGSQAQDERYVRYILARYAANPLVIWTLSNEWEYTGKGMTYWNRIGALVAGEDPYATGAGGARRLLSIHNKTGGSGGGRFAYGNCYAGAWSWGYHKVDGNGGWADTAPGMTRFNAAHPAEVQIPSGTGSAPPPSATAPPQATTPPVTATPVPTSPPSASATPVPGGSEQVIYDDALEAGWSNWSWGVSLRLDERTNPQQGRQAIAVSYQHAWAGLKLHHRAGLSTSRLTRLRFWVHGGTRGGQQLQLYLLNGNGWMSPLVRLPPLPAGRWSLIEIPLARLGSPPRVTDLILHERNGPHRETFFVDAISLAP